MPWGGNTLKRMAEDPAAYRVHAKKGVNFIVTSGGVIGAGFGFLYLHDGLTNKTVSLEQQVDFFRKESHSKDLQLQEKDFLLKDSQLQVKRLEEEQLKVIAQVEAYEQLLDNIPISEMDRDFFQKIPKETAWTDKDMRRAMVSIYKTARKVEAEKMQFQNAKSYGIKIDEE